MNDLISRQAAIEATWEEPTYSDPLNVLTEVRDRLKGLPSAQPEIIWCKDCKHWDGVDTCDVIDAPVWDNDFCSMAERRGEQNE